MSRFNVDFSNHLGSYHRLYSRLQPTKSFSWLGRLVKDACYMNQVFRFILVGIVNTGIGYGTIFGCMYVGGISPELSNVLGYLIGLSASYFLHRNYTFRSVQRRKTEFVRFVLVFLAAYTANLAVLIVLVRSLAVHAGLSQVIAGVFYVGTSYLLNKYYVFRTAEANESPLPK